MQTAFNLGNVNALLEFTCQERFTQNLYKIVPITIGK